MEFNEVRASIVHDPITGEYSMITVDSTTTTDAAESLRSLQDSVRSSRRMIIFGYCVGVNMTAAGIAGIIYAFIRSINPDFPPLGQLTPDETILGGISLNILGQSVWDESKKYRRRNQAKLNVLRQYNSNLP